jgi:hypothetical protein
MLRHDQVRTEPPLLKLISPRSSSEWSLAKPQAHTLVCGGEYLQQTVIVQYAPNGDMQERLLMKPFGACAYHG